MFNVIFVLLYLNESFEGEWSLNFGTLCMHLYEENIVMMRCCESYVADLKSIHKSQIDEAFSST